MKKFFLAITLTLLSFGFLASCSDDDEYRHAEISSFSFERAKNKDAVTYFKESVIDGFIDQKSKVITVLFEDSLYSAFDVRANLKPTVSLSSGTSQTTKELDFSKSPVNITVSTSDETVTYTVKIQKAGVRIPKNAVLFTEYYNGSIFNYKGTNNQFLEISNVSDDDYDISDVYLTCHKWLDGVRRSDLDQSISFNGITLSKAQSLVLYSKRASSLGFSDGVGTNGAIFLSDSSYNGIISFSGQDAFTLEYHNPVTKEVTVLDALGPQNGTGSGRTWGNTKQMQRKEARYTEFNERQWLTSNVAETLGEDVSTPQSDVKNTAGYKDVRANNAGVTSQMTGDDGLYITYFSFEDSDVANKIDIDHVKETVTLTLYFNDSPLKFKPAISTSFGANVIRLRSGSEQSVFKSGETFIDFSSSVNKTFDTTKLSLRLQGNTGADIKEYKIITQFDPFYFNDKTSGSYELVTDMSELKTGETVILYVPSESSCVGSKPTGSYLEEFSGDPTQYQPGMAAFGLTYHEASKVYSFTLDGKWLTSGKTGNSLTLAAAPSKYSTWKIIKAANTSKGISNVFIIENENASFSGNKQALEYYTARATFSSFTERDEDNYKFQIYKKVTEE